MRRGAGYGMLVVAALTYVGVRLAARGDLDLALAGGLSTSAVLSVATLSAIGLGAVGLSLVLGDLLEARTVDRRRRASLRNVVRLVVGLVAAITAFGVLTRQWVSVLFSLGVIGFAVTFALQQPLFSLIGWAYIVLRRPYEAGDRVAIGDSRGDVLSVGLFVTTLWEIDGDLVSTNQPSGRVVTFPNSVVLSSHVVNFGGDGVPYVWNELTVQVAYETDLAFASTLLREVADDHLGDDMERRVREYRDRLDASPVEIELAERPTVNVTQRESWVELRLRYLVHPRRGTRVRNELYREALSRFADHPDRVKFPVGRNR
ncbi:MAG: mechanosensitive ion channel family protein [Halobacteriaceae archaeon]